MNTLPYLLLVALLPMVPSATARDILVQPGGAVARIGQAVAQARPGDRIVVRAGVYAETLTLDKPLTLVGEGWPVLDGGGKHQIVTVTASGVTLRGFVFRNTGVSYAEDRAAVKFIGVVGCRVEGNRFEQTFFALYLARSADCVIAGNTIRGTGTSQTANGNGIHTWHGRNLRITQNHIEGQRDGIYLEFTRQTVVEGNTSAHNLRYGLHFMFSDSCRYEGNQFRNNEAGVAVMYSHYVDMHGNTFADNWGGASYGLLLKDLSRSHITGNTFVRNTTGLYAEDVTRTDVAANDFQGNGWALKIAANAQQNTFRDNNFLGNSFDVATNSRSSFNTFSANYWDRYEGYDLGRDGTGDVPFRPVRLFSWLVEQHEPSLVLLRSAFIDLLEVAERLLPVLTPATLLDEQPRMHPVLR
jgi:nitrous oxidase accessory protein